MVQIQKIIDVIVGEYMKLCDVNYWNNNRLVYTAASIRREHNGGIYDIQGNEITKLKQH